jgi:hypothetical protein
MAQHRNTAQFGINIKSTAHLGNNITAHHIMGPTLQRSTPWVLPQHESTAHEAQHTLTPPSQQTTPCVQHGHSGRKALAPPQHQCTAHKAQHTKHSTSQRTLTQTTHLWPSITPLPQRHTFGQASHLWLNVTPLAQHHTFGPTSHLWPSITARNPLACVHSLVIAQHYRLAQHTCLCSQSGQCTT